LLLLLLVTIMLMHVDFHLQVLLKLFPLVLLMLPELAKPKSISVLHFQIMVAIVSTSLLLDQELQLLGLVTLMQFDLSVEPPWLVLTLLELLHCFSHLELKLVQKLEILLLTPRLKIKLISVVHVLFLRAETLLI